MNMFELNFAGLTIKQLPDDTIEISADGTYSLDKKDIKKIIENLTNFYDPHGYEFSNNINRNAQYINYNRGINAAARAQAPIGNANANALAQAMGIDPGMFAPPQAPEVGPPEPMNMVHEDFPQPPGDGLNPL